MTIEEARTTLHDADARLSAVIESAAIVARSSDSTIDDLLTCLERGGLAAEFAAMELYRRTSRPVPSDAKKTSLKRREWEHFLDRNSKTAKKRLYVERRPEGDYAVRRGASERAIAVAPTQAEAIERAREVSPGTAPDVERVRHTSAGKPDQWRKA
jgi:hypothetical protein